MILDLQAPKQVGATDKGGQAPVKKHWRRVAKAEDHPSQVLEALQAES